jgi:hypothetical protein
MFPGRHISIARVMFWVACVAVFLTAIRHSHQFFGVVIAGIAVVVMWWETVATLIQLISGERPRSAGRSHRSPHKLTEADLWAMVADHPIRVELVSLRPGSRAEPEFSNVIDRTIDGRDYLGSIAGANFEPLDLFERGPVVIQHRLYGLCLAQPLAGRSSLRPETASPAEQTTCATRNEPSM